MAVTTLATSAVPVALSADAGTTYKSIVCRKSVALDVDSAVNEEQTDCGNFVSLGPVKWGFDVEGIVNTSPESTEVSYEDLLGYSNGQTSLLVRMQHPTSGSPGTNLYAQGACYITNLKLSGPSGSLLSFSCRITGTGTLDITP